MKSLAETNEIQGLLLVVIMRSAQTTLQNMFSSHTMPGLCKWSFSHEYWRDFWDVRKRLGITLVDLGHLVDIDSGNLSRFENGKQGMTTETLYKVMKALEISFAGPGIENQDAYLYPLLKWKGIGAFLSSGKGDGRALKSTQSAGEGAFWVEVVTDQMFSDHAPSFVEGTRILVDRRSTSLENGGLYIFNLAGSGEYVFRQYVGYDGAGFLRPLKSVYSPVPLPDDAIVIGRVVDSRQKGL